MGTGGARDRDERGSPAGRSVRRCLGRPAEASSATHLGRLHPRWASSVDPCRIRAWRAADRAALRRHVPRIVPRCALRRCVPRVRTNAHWPRSSGRRQQQARDELVDRGDRRPRLRGRARTDRERAVRDPRRRRVVRRIGGYPHADPRPGATATRARSDDANRARDRRRPARRAPSGGSLRSRLWRVKRPVGAVAPAADRGETQLTLLGLPTIAV